jgi:phosphatidylglycerol:prolipoprotein diacylglycerol transferase
MEYPEINPVAFDIGIPIYWYAIMYLIGISAALLLMIARSRYTWYDSWDSKQISDLVFWGALGMLLGGRLGYVFFYNFDAFVQDPATLFNIRQGGMAFHGGMIGVIAAIWLYGRSIGKSLFEITDFVAPVTPIGLGAGRIGNFINGELWGGPANVAWGMKVKCERFTHNILYEQYCSKGEEFTPALHPSQLYQFLLEGVVLFIILWIFGRKPRPLMSISGVFLLCYGVFRFVVEFVRLPDKQLGYLLFDWMTMGQILSMPMILVGAYLLWHSRKMAIPGSTPVAPGKS